MSSQNPYFDKTFSELKYLKSEAERKAKEALTIAEMHVEIEIKELIVEAWHLKRQAERSPLVA